MSGPPILTTTLPPPSRAEQEAVWQRDAPHSSPPVTPLRHKTRVMDALDRELDQELQEEDSGPALDWLTESIAGPSTRTVSPA